MTVCFCRGTNKRVNMSFLVCVKAPEMPALSIKQLCTSRKNLNAFFHRLAAYLSCCSALLMVGSLDDLMESLTDDDDGKRSTYCVIMFLVKSILFTWLIFFLGR
jgi:hypothetical protein